jgi:hypothetical protein
MILRAKRFHSSGGDELAVRDRAGFGQPSPAPTSNTPSIEKVEVLLGAGSYEVGAGRSRHSCTQEPTSSPACV